LKGKIDVLDLEDGRTIPVERKRAESGDYYWSDEVQIAGYCMMLEEHLDERAREGAIYLYETDQRMHVSITENHKEEVQEQVEQMRNLSVDDIPSLVDNRNKCPSCSARKYCMPKETAILEPEKAEGTGWEDRV